MMFLRKFFIFLFFVCVSQLCKSNDFDECFFDKTLRVDFIFSGNNTLSKAFGRIITFATANIHRCVLEEQNNKRSLLVYEVSTVKEAVAILQQIKACSDT